MSKNNKIFTTTLRLNLNNAQDAEAWDNLLRADTSRSGYSSYSKTIVTAINDHFARMDRPDQSDAEAAMMNRIEEAVHRAVVNALKENTAQAVARKPSKPGNRRGVPTRDGPVGMDDIYTGSL